MTKKTPLYKTHETLNASFGEFGGWEMPLWYPSGQIAEHLATRETCGLFDICHMGEFMVTGADSLAFFDRLLTNNVGKVKDGQAQYNFMLNEKGGVIDDCIVYRFNEERWMLVVNAGTQDGDFRWLRQHVGGDVTCENIGATTGKVDIQGPAAPKVVAKIAGEDAVSGMKFFRFIDNFNLGGYRVILSRTGYTGEIGFEIYCQSEETQKVWTLLMEAGKEFGITPAGLGARDTLRLEAGLPLHGHELHPDIPAVGTPWGFAMNREGDFIGRDALDESDGETYINVVVLDGRRKAPDHAPVFFNDEEIGQGTSSVLAVSLNRTPAAFIRTDRQLESGDRVILRGRKNKLLSAEVRANPLVKGTSRKKLARFLNN